MVVWGILLIHRMWEMSNSGWEYIRVCVKNKKHIKQCMIETPQWLSLVLRITSLSFTTACKDLPLQPQLLLSPHLLYSCCSGHLLITKTWFHYYRAFAPGTPTAYMASLPMLLPFYRFHYFIILINWIISILAQMSLLQHPLCLKLLPFLISFLFWNFTYQCVKWSDLLPF